MNRTPEFNGTTRGPVWEYEKQHVIEECTAEVCQELKQGSVSFMVYAYPPTAQIPDDDGGSAIKKRMTMRRPKNVEDDIPDEVM